MASAATVVFFGNQSEDSISDLPHLLDVVEDPLTLSFLEKAYRTLRTELGHDNVVSRDVIGSSSLKDLVWKYSQSGKRYPQLESALLFVYQVACFLRWASQRPESYLEEDSTVLVGSCTGLLAASAVSGSHSAQELVLISDTVLKIAYRIGSHVAAVRDDFTQITNQSWSAVFPGLIFDACTSALEDYSRSKRLSSMSQPYVSATGSHSVTISAPPHVLDDLIRSGEIGSTRPTRIPIYGPYHASHLYGEDCLETLIQESLRDEAEHAWIPRIPIVSNDEKVTYAPSTMADLWLQITQDILSKPVQWGRVLDNSANAVCRSQPSSCRIVSISTSHASKGLMHTLKLRSQLDVTIEETRSTADSPRMSTPKADNTRSKIAIVGMSGRFPHAASPQAFWDLLKQGLDVHEEVPKSRFNVATHYDASGKRKNTSHTPFGCFIDDPGLFDARFFNMSPKEAKQTDPMHRLALSTAYEAMEMSGFVPNRTPSSMADRVGTFYGQTSDDWREIQDGQDIQTYFIPGGVRAFAPGRINYHFKFSGPSYSVDTACSSSLAAIHIACNSLWHRDCDTAIAGGLNILTNPDIFAGLSRGQFLSKTGNCKTFDDGADGYCRGDGAGTVILKRLEDAEADNDPILAVILGVGTNHSAEAVSITHPHAGAQEFLFKKVLRDAGVDAHDVSYVEMHGTGTQAGDAIEMKSVLSSFAPEDRQRTPEQPLYLGSVKSNVGHGEAASGITALVKVLLMMDHQSIPPHCGIKGKINHNFPDLAARNVHISLGKVSPWCRPEQGKRFTVVNNFSAAGGNTSLLMEDPPTLAKRSNKSNHASACLVAVSAKTSTALSRNLDNLVKYLDLNPETDLSHLSYTTTARRRHYSYRAIVAGSDIATVRSELERAKTHATEQVASPSSIVFAFTGQGSHYSGMGKALSTLFDQFRKPLLRFDALAQTQGFPSIMPLIDGEAPIDSLDPVTVQLGAVCLQMALANLWYSWGVKPTAVIGHSLGEYPALYAAGVLSANDTIFLVGTRARLLQMHCKKNTHAMLVVSASQQELSQLVELNSVEIACLNGPAATVLSGPAEDIKSVAEQLEKRGTKSTKLELPYAFHSEQVDPVLDEFEAAASGVVYNKPSIPVMSPLLSRSITDEDTVTAAYLASHCRQPVNFLAALKAAEAEGAVSNKTIFVELGSHPLCSSMIRSTLGSSHVTLPSMRRNEDTWKVLSSSLCSAHMNGLNIDWDSYHRDFPDSHQCLRLPAYSWDDVNYWIDYRNDWCLTKGQDAPVSTLPTVMPSVRPTISSTVQSIVEEKARDDTITIVTETDILLPELENTVKGHLVNGLALCSSSVYADMAFTIADHLRHKMPQMNHDMSMNCTNMVVMKPLIANYDQKKPQLLRSTATAHASRGHCDISFYSVNEHGKKTTDHATCRVLYGDTDKLKADLSLGQHLVQSQMNRLIQRAETGDLDRLRRNMAYKLFSVLVDYQDVYKGMAEVILDSPQREGCARIELAQSADGTFFIPPYHIDSLCHLAGFIMNANDEVDATKAVYVNHGWKSLQFLERPDPTVSYWSYVRMQPAKSGSKDYVGNVYMCDAHGRLIGQIGSIEFQHLPKKVLDSVLPSPKVSTAKPIDNVSSPPPMKRQTNALSTKIEQAASPLKQAPSEACDTKSMVDQAVNIMADEIGVNATELRDPNDLASLGFDSLMSLTVSGKFREDLGLDVPSTLFTDCQTIGDVKGYLSQHSSSSTSPSLSSEASDVSTPDTAYSEDDNPKAMADKGTRQLESILSVIADETGVSSSDITSSTEISDIGIDSLMSLQILGALREDHAVDLPSDFFSEHQTIGEIESSVAGGKPAAPNATKTLDVDYVKDALAEAASKDVAEPPKPSKKAAQASSVLLQGSLRTASQILFLFPDGSGTASSYSTLPSIAPQEVAVVGLNCPFMKTPDDFDCGIEGVVSLYLAEVRRRQPHGPYVLGGWSAGGICAYEAALQLQAAGEEVQKLIFVDVPCPLPPQALPARLHEFFDEIGLLGPQGHAPNWLVPHFRAVIRALSTYAARSMDPAAVRVPHVFSIMAQDGVCKHPSDPRPELLPDDPPHMQWLLFNRTDFGPIGWEKLFGGKQHVTSLGSVPDANHFTMMRQPAVDAVADRIREALECKI